MIDYYDKILIAIAGSLLVGILIGIVTTLTVQMGILVGTVIATVFVYDAIFRNPPLPTTDPRVAALAIGWHAVLLVLAVSVVVG